MAKLYGKGTIVELIAGKKYKITFSYGKDPDTGAYRRHVERFLGTKRQAELRVEELRVRYERIDELRKLGLDFEELESYGLDVDTIISMGMSNREVAENLAQRKEERAHSITFGDYIEQYMRARETMGNKRRSTLKKDRSNSKHLLDALKNIPLTEITPERVRALYVSMRDAGVGDTALFESHRLLKRVLKEAVADDIIAKNPVDRVEPPKTPAPERTALETDDMKRMTTIVTTGKPSAYKTAVCLGLSLGARLGEVLGLTWGHVSLDGDRPYAYIVQQHTRYNERTALKTDKDERPIGRVVPLDNTTVEALRSWKVEQRSILNELGIEQGTGTPIVTNAYGDWVGHPKFSKWFREFCVANGFGHWVSDDGKRIVELTIGDDPAPYTDCIIEWHDEHGWNCDETGKRYSRTHKRPKVKKHYRGLVFHELRHSHFTRRLANGMDIPTAQALGGWSKPTMLLNTYSHPVPENVWASAGFMDDLK